MSSQASAGSMALPPDRDARSLGPAADHLAAGGGGGGGAAGPPKSFLRQAMTDTFRRTGAKLGAMWVAVLVFSGVLAPFVANTHPLLLKMEDRWSSPLLRNLTPADVVLLVSAFAVIVALLARQVRK